MVAPGAATLTIGVKMLAKICIAWHGMQDPRCRCVNCHLSVLSGPRCTSLRYVHEGLSVCVGHWMHLPVICASWANGSERHICLLDISVVQNVHTSLYIFIVLVSWAGRRFTLWGASPFVFWCARPGCVCVSPAPCWWRCRLALGDFPSLLQAALLHNGSVRVVLCCFIHNPLANLPSTCLPFHLKIIC